MSTTIHACLSVRGALSWPKSKLRMFRDDAGKRAKPDEVRQWLMDHLSEGHEVIPLGKKCEGFSWKDGCPGHEASADEGTP